MVLKRKSWTSAPGRAEICGQSMFVNEQQLVVCEKSDDAAKANAIRRASCKNIVGCRLKAATCTIALTMRVCSC